MEKEHNTIGNVHPVDELLPAPKLFAFGLQHVLAMYAGAIAVPIIIAGALHLTEAQKIMLINADLLACGIATLIQTLGFIPFVGAKIPMIQGVSFASVAPMIAIGVEHGKDASALPYIFGAVIAAGIFAIIISGVFSKLIRFFPPVVTGTVITTIGIVLMPVAVKWCAGGVGAKDFGALHHIGMALLTLIIVLVVYKFGHGFVKNVAVLVGLLLGTVIASFAGLVNYANVAKAQWIGLSSPFAFGLPRFDDYGAILSMIVVMLVIMVETTGDCIAIGEIIDKPADKTMLSRCLRADGLSTAVAACINSFPHSAFAQNVGLVAVTNVKSRFVVACSGLILIILGLFPKLAAVIASIPASVLGGAGIAMFGMVIASGIRALSRVKFDGTYNLMIVAVSLAFGIITMAVPNFYAHFPKAVVVVMHSGITAASIVAVILNVCLNGIPSDTPHDAETKEEAIGSAFRRGDNRE